VQPAATRQSYQDSDIFGYKAGAETVQKSAYVDNSVKQRSNGTFTSNVFGGSDNVNSNEFVGAGNVTRDEKKWQSTVFAGPQNEQSKRPRLGKNGVGREGLFGNTGEPDAYQRKTTFAAEMSQREETKPPKFEEAWALERKHKELHGNSLYGVPVVEVKQVQHKPAHVGFEAQLDRNTQQKKANQLTSNILSNDGIGEERAQWNKPEKLPNPSTSWNSQTNMQKVGNVGKIDPYRAK